MMLDCAVRDNGSFFPRKGRLIEARNHDQGVTEWFVRVLQIHGELNKHFASFSCCPPHLGLLLLGHTQLRAVYLLIS